jgi:cyclopropane-fatty-acyl-phospholipid synthase
MTLAQVFERVAGPDAPVEFTAYDGSRAGAEKAEVRIDVRSPYAISYLLHSRGALGLARAYISGHLDVHGDMYTALVRMSQVLGDLSVQDRLRVLRGVASDPLLRAAAATHLEPPPQEVRVNKLPFLAGLRHSKRRDAEAIHHHYDVSNRFYEWVLGPSMAYTCACFPVADATLEQAQFHKHDLVARKLDLKPGMRLLDVGCGWGGMVMHAAKQYGVKALGVTLSKQQAEWAQKAIAERGLSDLAEVRHLDYRDVRETGFDAVSSIGLTEHIGKANLPFYFSFLYGKLKPGGRMLNHTITRPDNTQPSMRKEGFINRYVFPDGELEGPGYVQSVMNDQGFEIRHQENLREHYAKTLTGWCANLDDHWDEAVAEVGEGTARVWRLYMAGCRYGFEQNWIQLHQTLGVKLGPDKVSGMPLRPHFEPPFEG